MNSIEIVSKDNCSACKVLKELLDTTYNDLFQEVIVKDLNVDISVQELTDRLGYAPRSVPQVFIDGRHIGGKTQAVKLIENYIANRTV